MSAPAVGGDRRHVGGDVVLYVIPGSHACRTAMLMLEHKRIGHRLVELPTGPHSLLVRALGFPGHREPIRSVDGRTSRRLALLDRMGTVPAMRYGSARVQTNREIARFLDRVVAEPALFPADPARRSAVEEAELWADRHLQMLARRLALVGPLHGLDTMSRRGNDGRLGALLTKHELARSAIARTASVMFGADARAESEMLAALPQTLDRVDRLIVDGVLGGAELNAADFAVAPSLALLAYRLDLRPEIERRAAGALVERILPERDGAAARPGV
ncbi:MAG: glutathione S-transferase [Solirubrobacteraceae bacterium]|jgi:glutathione S-transferase|nr:glutathione S-transferase [Solirubrobacteraceae bacterium]